MQADLLNKLSSITEEEERILSSNTLDHTLYSKENESIINASVLLKQGKIITLRPHTRFIHFPKHTHDYVEVIYMCKGHTTHIINDETIELKEGELLFLNQNCVQEILPASVEDIAVNFIILPTFFDSVLDLIEEEDTPLRSFIIDALRSDCTRPEYLYFQVADIVPIQNLMENLILSLIEPIGVKRSISRITMGLLLLHLIAHSERLTYKDEDDQLVLLTLNYIETNYRDGSLGELAEMLHYDFNWFSRQIRRKTGFTYTELVQKKRLSQAAYLLLHTHLSIDEIAYKVGYKNMSYFHRLFQKNFGMTPHRYRMKKKDAPSSENASI